MNRQSVIILINEGKEPVCRGNLKKLCLEFGLPYHSLKDKDFPIVFRDMVIYRVPFR
jgi:hypothetical protein